MRGVWIASIVVAAGCHGGNMAAADAPDSDAAPDAVPDAAGDVLAQIFGEVDPAHVAELVKEMSGVTPVAVGGNTFTIAERYSATGRASFRAYWSQYMTNLGLTVTPMHFDGVGAPRPGDDVEAVLAGARADSIVVIVHYDSVGPPGMETTNPGADDDMTGMAIMLETARVLAAHRDQLGTTVRFVASDEEELGGLSGARYYASTMQARAQAQGFQLIAAVDDEQTGWNCRAAGACNVATWPAFDVFSCDGQQYDYTALGDQFVSIVSRYEPTMRVERACMGANSDHYAMWEIGVPAVVFSEHDPFDNDHFDQQGGDTFDKIDTAYLGSIARAAVTFQASLAGIGK